jgi:hypothetical protein
MSNNTFNDLQTAINNITTNMSDDFEQEMKNKLHNQLHLFANSDNSTVEMTEILFHDDDLTDQYAMDLKSTEDVREIQHQIMINFSND